MKKDKPSESKAKNNEPETKKIVEEAIVEPKKKFGSVSIKDSLSVSSKKTVSSSNTLVSDDYVSPDMNEAFDVAKLKQCLADFVRIKKFHERVKCVLLSHEPEIVDNTIILGIDNLIQESDFVKLKPMVLKFLKKELKNYNIDLKAIIANSGSAKKTFTDIEKFKSLCKKNPALKLLHDKMSLDFE